MELVNEQKWNNEDIGLLQNRSHGTFELEACWKVTKFLKRINNENFVKMKPRDVGLFRVIFLDIYDLTVL